MNLLQIIGLLGVAAVGFILGIIVELCIDAKTITDLQEKNRKLSLVNEQLRKQVKQEVIEIIDKTVDIENVPSFEQNW